MWNEICDKHVNKGKSTKELANEYGLDQSTIRKRLSRANIKIRRELRKSTRIYKVNESYFEKIDTPEKSYNLGLLYTDGSVDGKSIKLELHENDLETIKKFKIKSLNMRNIQIEYFI